MRGKRAKKRPLVKDKKNNDEVIGRLINKVMLDGKKSLAQ